MDYINFPKIVVCATVWGINLLISDRKKIEILRALSNGKVHTYYHLSRQVRTNYDTIKMNCDFLELLGFVEVDRITKEQSASSKAHYAVRGTPLGMKWLENVQSKRASYAHNS